MADEKALFVSTNKVLHEYATAIRGAGAFEKLLTGGHNVLLVIQDVLLVWTNST